MGSFVDFAVIPDAGKEGLLVEIEIGIDFTGRDNSGQNRGIRAGIDLVANGQFDPADTPADRGFDKGMIQFDFSQFKIGLGTGDLTLCHAMGIQAFVIDAFGNRAVRHQLFRACLFLGRQRQILFGCGQFGTGFVHGGLIAARINHGKHIALLNKLAVFKPDFDDRTADLRAQLHFFNRAQTAGKIVPKTDGTAFDVGYGNRGCHRGGLNRHFVGR